MRSLFSPCIFSVHRESPSSRTPHHLCPPPFLLFPPPSPRLQRRSREQILTYRVHDFMPVTRGYHLEQDQTCAPEQKRRTTLT